jgi:hypothetical protein
MILTDWSALLNEPKSILGPYQGKAPRLDTFAPYAWRAQFDHVAIAGQFMQLPEQVPSSWGSPEQARAEVVFEFEDVRVLRVDGVLERSAVDDSLHGAPHGMPGQCSLNATPEPYLEVVEAGITLPWKQFKFVQPTFSISLEAGYVSLYCGRRVSGQFGHKLPYR